MAAPGGIGARNPTTRTTRHRESAYADSRSEKGFLTMWRRGATHSIGLGVALLLVASCGGGRGDATKQKAAHQESAAADDAGRILNAYEVRLRAVEAAVKRTKDQPGASEAAQLRAALLDVTGRLQ